jgi:Domain of unknown function (DUF222)/HNH endonuclease
MDMGEGVWQRGRDELLHELRELESRMRRDYAAALELIAELDVRNASVECGYSSMVELLRDVLRITAREAKRRIVQAHLVTEAPLVSGGTVPAVLPVTGAAVREGVLGADHVDVIARSLTGLPLHVQPRAIADAEQTLVTAAASMDARTLARVGARVRAALDQDGTAPNDAELANPINELHLNTRSNGRTVFRGELEPEASALFRALLSPLAKPRPSGAEGPDPRTPAERHGDAFADLLRLAAGSAELPDEAGEKPHVLVTVPLRVLRESLGATLLDGPRDLDATLLDGAREPGTALLNGADELGIALLDGAGELDAASARRIACDAKVIPAVLGAASEPLDMGRASYTAPTALRRALVLRDGGCAFPGCDRPHRWCHSHHVKHWADGGATELNNLVLLCGHHHRLLHHSGWECAIVGGLPEFYPPCFIDPTRSARRNIMHPLQR